MAHELEKNEKGEARMMYVGETPWHGLGVKLDKEVTSEAAIRMAQLDWTVSKHPIYFEGAELIETHEGVKRDEDGKPIGIVRKTYHVIQNKEVFDFMDALVGEGLAMYHTAGSLFGGSRIFISCKLPNSLQVGPDKVDKYLLACSSHDATLGFHLKWTPVRTVCWNTLMAAMNIREHGRRAFVTDAVTIRHTVHYKDQIEEARRLLELTDVYYQRLQETFDRLIATPVKSKKEVDKLTVKLYPDVVKVDKDTGKASEEASAAAKKARTTIARLFKEGQGNQHPDVAGTRWALYNGVTEFIDHWRPTKPIKNPELDVRMDSLIWGNGAAVKKKALALLTKKD